MLKSLKRIAEKLKIKLFFLDKSTFEYYYEDCGAFYHNMFDAIICGGNKSLDLMLAHELIHATGHYTRLNRGPIGLVSSGKKARIGFKTICFEELVAELGSIMLLKKLGLKKSNLKKHTKARLEFVKTYRKQLSSSKKTLAKERAKRAVELLLSV
jgi:antirestriction protein ArdC